MSERKGREDLFGLRISMMDRQTDRQMDEGEEGKGDGEWEIDR